MDFMFTHGGYGRTPMRFDCQYNCFSMAILGRTNLDEGDKVILPQSALDILAQMNVEYPLLFELSHRNGKSTHCGVLEFSAEEGRCYIPFWMMNNLGLTEGVIINLKNVSLSKAKFVKFKPQSVDFIEITNPRVVLENALRKFTCLTVGDTIQIQYSGTQYHLKIVDLKPNNAVSIVETDCEVDFEEPEGYKESKYYKTELENKEKALQKAASASRGTDPNLPLRPVQKARADSADEDIQVSFQAFSGTAKRIDGRPLHSTTLTTTSTTASAKVSASAAAIARASVSSTPPSTPAVPQYQSKIGDKFSKIKASSSAFTGTAKKLT